jgi:hypothetical protein
MAGLGLLASGLITPCAAQDSGKSSPPDTTIYERLPIPDDYAPAGRAALPESASGALSVIRIVDAVVSNTDATLKNTDAFSDSEMSIAVNPANPDRITMTAFSGAWGADAPLWVSADGGQTWTKQFTAPVPPGVSGTAGCPCDQTVDYGRASRLFGTFLTFSPDNVYSGTTLDPTSAAAWNWRLVAGTAQRTNQFAVDNADQPWLLVNRDPGVSAQDNVYVAYDDFSVFPIGMRVAVAKGTIPPNFTVDNSDGASSNFLSGIGVINPGHRLAVDPGNGTVYSAFQQLDGAGAGSSLNVGYILNRSTDGGVTWGVNGHPNGIVIATADSTQGQPATGPNTFKFGTVNALLGGIVHVAVAPSTGDVYYVYGNRDAGTGNNRLAIRRIVDNGAGGVTVGSENFVTGQVQAAIPSVAVTHNGAVGVFYYTSEGIVSGFPSFTAHLAVSTDLGVTFTDQPLLNFLSPATDNGNARQRVLGDYMQLKAIDSCFYGAFTGNGLPFGRSTSNMDPLFYKACMPTFIDVAATDPFFAWIEALATAGITGGCSTSPPEYCPNDGVTRAQMAVFLDRGVHGAGFVPPPATGTMFTDVPASNPFAKWIEQLARDGITSGCGGTMYCPDDTVIRAEMAVFLLRAEHGGSYQPPPATGTMFADVPASDPFAKWIEQLAREGTTGGCGGGNYCPGDPVTRGQMAVFLDRDFNIPM